MQVALDTNATHVSTVARWIFRDQVPFAASKAINETLKDAQRAQRAHMRQAFTIRRRPFAERAVKIKPFANKRRLHARIKIEPPGGQERANIFTRHEVRGIREPIEGRSLAVPIGVRRKKTSVVRRERRPPAFKFREVGSGRRVAMFKGVKRTFMLQSPDGTGYIIQRTGRRKTRLLYRLVPSVPIAPRLAFLETVGRVVRANFPTNFRRAFIQAVRTRRR